jgi:hypothetical protein
VPVVEELLPAALHGTTQYANNRIECDHGRLEARLRPMRGLRTARAASTVIRGHALFRICDVLTTNSASRPATNVCDSRQPSMSSPPRSDPTSDTTTVGARVDRSTQQFPGGLWQPPGAACAVGVPTGPNWKKLTGDEK